MAEVALWEFVRWRWADRHDHRRDFRACLLMGTLLAILLASVQEPLDLKEFLPNILTISHEAQRAPKAREWTGSADFTLRYTMIGGDTGASDLKTWDKIFEDGIGFRTEWNYIYNFNDRWGLGGYFSSGLEFFRGKDGFTDPAFPGIEVGFDDWLNWTFSIGAKGYAQLGKGWFTEGYLGFGFVTYGNVDAEISGAASGSAGFIDSSLAFCWEIGVRVGYKFNADRGRLASPQVGLLFGIGLENWDEPSVDPATFSSGSAKSVESVTIDLGLWVGF